MADDLERASDYEEAHRAFCVKNAQAQAQSMRPKGRCYFCGEPVAASLIYCDEYCCADHEREKAARRRAGRM